MARILILIGKHINTAPRAQKEALALSRLGHDVRIIGTWSNEQAMTHDKILLRQHSYLQYEPALDFRSSRKIVSFTCRVEHRVAKGLYKFSGIVIPALFGYAPRALLKAALKEKADLTIAHSEATMWVALKLRQKGYNVGVDFEDWFSKDSSTLPALAAELGALEKTLLRTSKYTIATSKVMAKALAEHYDAPTPTVVYNSFPLSDRDSLDGETRDRKDRGIPSLHWFSQTIGAGRGLDTLLKAMVLVEHPLELHLRGTLSRGFKDMIRPLLEEIPQHHIFFHDIVPNEQLLSRIAEHDIGICLEDKSILNKDLTVANKLFQYMLAGLGVIASETAGQMEVMGSWAEDLQSVPKNDIESLSASIRHYVENPEALKRIKALSLEAARNEYHFEMQFDKYKTLLERALEDT